MSSTTNSLSNEDPSIGRTASSPDTITKPGPEALLNTYRAGADEPALVWCLPLQTSSRSSVLDFVYTAEEKKSSAISLARAYGLSSAFRHNVIRETRRDENSFRNFMTILLITANIA
jgi:hypothetical protein